MLQALVDNHRIDPNVLPTTLAVNGSLLPFDQVNDTDATEIPDILKSHGITVNIDQYITDSSSGVELVRSVVFGGIHVAPDTTVYDPVLRAASVPDTLNRWDRKQH